MADVKIASDKADLVKRLKQGDNREETGPFSTYVEVVIFAAALGLKKGVKKAVTSTARSPDPIKFDYFENQGFGEVVELIAIADSNDPVILASDKEAERAEILEAYANGGFQILQDSIKDTTNVTQRLLLFLADERKQEHSGDEELDLGALLGFDDL